MGDKVREVRGGRVGEAERVREMGEGSGVVEVREGFRDRGVDGGDGENEICALEASMYESSGAGSAQRSEWGVARGDCSWGGRIRWPLLWWVGIKSVVERVGSGWS